MLDELLNKYNLKYEDLKIPEKETLMQWMESIQKNQLTLEKVKENVHFMKNAVAEELSKEPEYKTILFFKVRNDTNILLKARLANYIFLEAFLTGPERAKEQLEQMLSGLKP